MKFHILFLLAIIILLANSQSASAQVDSVLGQLSASLNDSFGGGMSGDGRLVVFESNGNLATENPRNTDGNREIFLFDYAQRRIFQITDTKSLLTDTTLPVTFDNIKVDMVNSRPVISQDGLWIAFGSNATYAYPGNGTIPPIISASNPGNFDANSFTVMGANNLVNDGNTELWVYSIPPLPPADLSSGAEIPITDLSTGTFTRATNTLASRLPQPGDDDPPTIPIIASDNADPSITDNGSHVAFVSNRDLEPGVGNSFPTEDNEEIFVLVRGTGVIKQVTKTPRTPPSSPTKNLNPTISTIAGGTNLRVVFYANADNPIVGMTGGTNSDRNNEIFYADLDATGSTFLTRKQITSTTGTAGQTLNILNYGRRMSRDGRLIAFDSYADLANEHSGANQVGFALFIYDVTANTFRRIGPRGDADATATGGDIARYPGFTDNSVSGVPNTLVLETRMNIKADGTVAAVNDDGLNPNTTRPAQIYSYPLNVAPASATFTRLTKLPTPFFTLASAQPHTGDSLKRMAFTLGLTETGTGNLDFSNEVYYLLQKDTIRTTPATMSFATGASRIPVSNDPVPTPSPTPTPSPSPSPTPTPQTPPAVQGLSPGMLAILDYQAGINTPVVAAEAIGSLERSFTLPIELSGVTMTINGAACGLKRVSQRQIVFVVPPGLSIDATTLTFSYPVVINNNGTVIKGNITIVPARPDIFTDLPTAGPGGRTRILNATNAPFFNGEPFTVTTIKRRGSRKVPTVLRVYLTGVNFFTASAFSIRVGGTTISGAAVVSDAIEREPGVYTVDFTLPPELNAAGDVPIIVTVTVNGATFTSRLDDTASRFRIL